MDRIGTRPSDTGQKAIVKEAVAKDTLLCSFNGPKLSSPTMHTVQITDTVHIEPTHGAQYVDHTCAEPNCTFIIDEEKETGKLVALKDLAAGDPLLFNYNTTEWEMQSPFACCCKHCSESGRPNVVKGFKYLTTGEKQALLQTGYVSPVVKRKSYRC